MYDHAITFLDEIDLVWSSSWGPGKILFLFARYMTWPELVSGLVRAYHAVSLSVVG